MITVFFTFVKTEKATLFKVFHLLYGGVQKQQTLIPGLKFVKNIQSHLPSVDEV